MAYVLSRVRYMTKVKNTDDLVPHANRLLILAAKGAWRMTKFLAGVAIRIPGWFVRINERGARRDRRVPDRQVRGNNL
jgi:hypothetical protein